MLGSESSPSVSPAQSEIFPEVTWRRITRVPKPERYSEEPAGTVMFASSVAPVAPSKRSNVAGPVPELNAAIAPRCQPLVAKRNSSP